MGRLIVPLLLFGALDLLVRGWMAGLLDLHFEGTRLAALGAAGLGTGRDLALLIPTYALYALWPDRASRAIATAAFGLALAVLAADAAYFVWTFEHVEPVLFQNLNPSSVGGVLGGTALLGVAAGGLALALLLSAHARWLARPGGPRGARPAIGLVVAAACLLALPNRIQVARAAEPRGIEDLLEETRDDYLARVSAPILENFASALRRWPRLERPPAPRAFEPYTGEERAALAELGLLRVGSPAAPAPAGPGAPSTGSDPTSPAAADPAFQRIVLLVFESLPAAYLHHENPAIPPEATPTFDALLREHPHLDRFYTSNMPTDYGLNSLLLSRLAPDWRGGRESLLGVLRREAGFETWFVRAVSKHYGNQLVTYPRLFQMDHFLAYEELQARHRSSWHSGWGVNNGTVYSEGLRILKENRDRRVLLVLKTIDLHQPGPFRGIPSKYLPPALRERGVPLFDALHWVDKVLGAFLEDLEREQLLDPRTLVVVTSDHGPHPGAAFRAAVPPHEYQRLARLPLVFVTPNRAALRDLDLGGLASQLDLAPTILDLLGIATPADFLGRSLLGRDPERFRLGLYDGTLFYASDRVAFREPVASATAAGDSAAGLRSRALRKWLANQDARPPAAPAALTRR